MSLSKITGIDILVKHLTILMSLVTVPWKLTNRFSWIMRNCQTLEKPCSITTGWRDEQQLLKKELTSERCSGVKNKSKEDCTVFATRS